MTEAKGTQRPLVPTKLRCKQCQQLWTGTTGVSQHVSNDMRTVHNTKLAKELRVSSANRSPTVSGEQKNMHSLAEAHAWTRCWHASQCRNICLVLA